ncbi:DNA/RNA non-specific endonuclease family protein [Leishmania donovani]|uniref:DNA/RNA non-specific endonuclease family protein n=1 Tax=Leishmania donovani TaxID=5661 RepID=A0A504XRV4_LEIDO|nr:DNA/RNA non-specific endonuclease family protein [Leishmania donovani]
MLRVMRISYRVPSDKKAKVSARMARLQCKQHRPRSSYAESFGDGLDIEPSPDKYTEPEVCLQQLRMYCMGNMDLPNRWKNTGSRMRFGAPSSRSTTPYTGALHGAAVSAARRLLHDHAYFAAGALRGARAQPTPASSLSSPAPSQPLKLWLTCATAAVAGTCGVIVGAHLSPWLSRRAARLYTQREAKYRNPLQLLPSPAAAAWPESWWWRRLWCSSAHRSVSETRRLDYGHAAEWLAACTGHRWLPQRISRPTLLKLYSPARHSRQSSADRDTAKEVQWGTRMVNKGTRPLAKRSAAAAAASRGSTASLAASALFSIARLTRAPLHQWQPLPQHLVDVFVSATCQNTENPRSATRVAASPLLCLPRQGFTLLYDPVARLSVWCGYYLTRETVDRARRQNRCITFFTDRSLDKTARRVPAELKARGHDRGHLAPHASVAASPQAAIEAALLSNVLLQHRQINRGVWRWLEAATRAYVRQLPLADVPHAVAIQQQRVRKESSTGAVGAGTASLSEAASSTQADSKEMVLGDAWHERFDAAGNGGGGGGRTAAVQPFIASVSARSLSIIIGCRRTASFVLLQVAAGHATAEAWKRSLASDMAFDSSGSSGVEVVPIATTTTAPLDAPTALRSLVVSTVELEQLFAESLVELRSRCMSAGVTDATSRDSMSNIDRAAPSVALRTHFSLFPVYRQRWMWRHCGIGGGGR